MSRAEPARVPVALLGLSVVPLTAGTLRLVQLAGGPEVMPADDRFPGLPVALVAHILGAGVYAVLGAFQLSSGSRRRDLERHRRTGRVVAAAGLLVTGSALWMTLVFAPKPGTGLLLVAFRLVFSALMLGSLVLGVRAARNGDVPAHRAWMVRAYAVGLGAGTQVLTQGIAEAAGGTGPVVGDLAMGAGWAINLLVAEWAIRRPAARPIGALT